MSYENEATNTLERKAYLSILGLETSNLATSVLSRMAYIQMIEGGGTPTGDFIGVPSDLFSNKNYKFAYDSTTEKMDLKKLEMGEWVTVLTLGSAETSMFISNKPFGGYRGLGADGYEYFIGRISTGGDGRSVILGSFDTGNYLACSSGYIMVHKLEEQYIFKGYDDKVVKKSMLLDSLSFSFTATEDCLIDKIVLDVIEPFKDIYFNTYVTDSSGQILYSDILDDDINQGLWARGKRVEKFKISREVGEQEFLMPQPIPVREDQTINVYYQFSKALEFNCDEEFLSILWKLKGNKLKAANVATFTTGNEELRNKLGTKYGMTMYDEEKRELFYNAGGFWMPYTDWEKTLRLIDGVNIRGVASGGEQQQIIWETDATLEVFTNGGLLAPVLESKGAETHILATENILEKQRLTIVIKSEKLKNKKVNGYLEWYNKPGDVTPQVWNAETWQVMGLQELKQFRVQNFSINNKTMYFDGITNESGEFAIIIGAGNFIANDKLFFGVTYSEFDRDIEVFDAYGDLKEDVTRKLVRKYRNGTNDFYNFFEKSGIYRGFNMEENLPPGYKKGDNDFYMQVYMTDVYDRPASDAHFIRMEVIDVRSQRKFTLEKLDNNWQPWIEWTNASGSMIPKLIKVERRPVLGSVTLISFEDLGIDGTENFMVSCGSSGMAIKVPDIADIELYSCTYFIDNEHKMFAYYIEEQGMSGRNLAIYKYEEIPPQPPVTYNPYVKLIDVLEDIAHVTRTGDIFNIDIEVKNSNLLMKPYIRIDTVNWWQTADIVFDGKAKYYFNFPIDVTETLPIGSEVNYTVYWQDKNGMNYTGFEIITKHVI